MWMRSFGFSSHPNMYGFVSLRFISKYSYSCVPPRRTGYYFCGLFQAEKISTHNCGPPHRERVAQELCGVTSSCFGLRHNYPDQPVNGTLNNRAAQMCAVMKQRSTNYRLQQLYNRCAQTSKTAQESFNELQHNCRCVNRCHQFLTW